MNCTLALDISQLHSISSFGGKGLRLKFVNRVFVHNFGRLFSHYLVDNLPRFNNKNWCPVSLYIFSFFLVRKIINMGVFFKFVLSFS